MVLVMGAEGDGMRKLTAKQCDFFFLLPMAGEVESLNVSVATGVCLFEIVRQRGLSQQAKGAWVSALGLTELIFFLINSFADIKAS